MPVFCSSQPHRPLRAAGAGQVLGEVASGAKTDRSQLRRALAQLDAGDVLMVIRVMYGPTSPQPMAA